MEDELIRMTLDVDQYDYESILDAVAKYQREHRVEGELIIADGEGDLRGRILAELCRDWSEYWDRVCAGRDE